MLKVWSELLRPFTLLVPAVGVGVGVACAALSTPRESWLIPESFIWPVAIALALAAALLNGASNAINQVCDLAIDRIAKPSRPIPQGRITPSAAATFAGAVYVVAMLLVIAASAAAHRFNFAPLAVFAIALLLTLAYSVRPVRTRSRGWWANVTIAVPRGLLLFGAGWCAVADLWRATPWLVGAAPGLYLLGAASTKDFADIEGDRADGVRTLPIMYGVERSIRIIAPLLVLPFALAAAWGVAVAVDVPLGVTANGWVVAALGGAIAIWGAFVARMLLRDPHALATTENHPAWKHMYLMMLVYYLGILAAHVAA